MTFGKITGETGEEYHAQQAISNSKLKVFARRPGGPILFYEKYIAKTLGDKKTDALAFGQAFHTIVLEPDKFDAQIAIEPEGIDRRTTFGKAAYASFLASSKGKTTIDSGDFATLTKMSTQIERHPSASQLLDEGEPEITWRIKAGGYKYLWPLQVRTDFWNPNGCALSEGRPYVVDLKSCATLDSDAFGSFKSGAEEHGYHVQFALYLAVLQALGVECRDFFVIAAEKAAPFGVEVYRMGDRALEEGQRICDELLTELDGCLGRNEFPNTSLDVQEFKLSGRYWAKRKNAEEAIY